MKKAHFSSLVFCFISAYVMASGFDIKTSSVISHPDLEVLGEYQGSWYAIAFEKPGNLNKPPQYRILKYSAGFTQGKTSDLYPSFGEKTYYLRAAFVNNKISLFYSRCELRADEEAMMDKREGRQVMPVIERQDFDLATLLPTGDAEVIFNKANEYYSASGIEITESDDRSKTAVLIKPYYKYQKYTVIITDNKTGSVFQKTFDFKGEKEYLRFLQAAVSNTGQMYVISKRRDDMISFSAEKDEKEGSGYFVFSINNQTDTPKIATLDMGDNKNIADPKAAVLSTGELVIAADYYADASRQYFKGVQVAKYDAELNVAAKREVTPAHEMVPMALSYHNSKRSQVFSKLETQEILPLEGGRFMLLTEHHAKVPGLEKDAPPMVERSYMVAFRMDESANVKSQHFIHKKQVSSVVDYAFSALAFRKGNDVYLFYNSNWESDEEHNMNLQCTHLPEKGSAKTRKVLNTSGDFFTSMKGSHWSGDGKILFRENRLVDYGDVTQEVKLLEVTVK